MENDLSTKLKIRTLHEIYIGLILMGVIVILVSVKWRSIENQDYIKRMTETLTKLEERLNVKLGKDDKS